MDHQIATSRFPAAQVIDAVSAALGCQPRQTSRGWEWDKRGESGVLGAVLTNSAESFRHIEVLLATVPETAACSVETLWHSLATLIQETETIAVPIPPTKGDAGLWQIGARMKLRDAPMDLPRIQRLHKTFESLDRCAKLIQAELPARCRTAPVQLPSAFKGVVAPCEAKTCQDSDKGSIASGVLRHLDSCLSVAMVGGPPRIRLELDRLARRRPNLVILREAIAFQKLPQLANALRGAGLVLASHCALLRPRASVYEQGRELDATLLQLEAAATPVLFYGTREELEASLGVGQGRDYSPLRPIIEQLPAAHEADLVRAILAHRPGHLASHKVEQIVSVVVQAAMAHAPGKEEVLQPLAHMAAEHGPGDPGLPDLLSELARDLVGRRETFGTCSEAPAKPRASALQKHLMERLQGTQLEVALRHRIIGQDQAVTEVARRVWEEAICRPLKEPLRLFLAGPVGTGKSLAAKCVAEQLEWDYHYLDAASFDSSHAVMTSLAGASPGIVNSYNDGVLAKIARRPSVVEVADLDHAQPGVKGTLCDFFLRVLQEGTLQTGSGMIVRTIPSLLFCFTSNVAYGSRKPNARFGFGLPTREEVREEVASRAREDLGHAFISRVGEPILFDEFSREVARQIVRAEIDVLVSRTTGATDVAQSDEVAVVILRSLPALEHGARGILDETRARVAEALRHYTASGKQRMLVRCEGEKVLIEPRENEPQQPPGVQK
jgi:hypothetical protein